LNGRIGQARECKEGECLHDELEVTTLSDRCEMKIELSPSRAHWDPLYTCARRDRFNAEIPPLFRVVAFLKVPLIDSVLQTTISVDPDYIWQPPHACTGKNL
jgi:hypothetical protein